jgi:predicted nucleotidyltransferase
MRKIRSDGKPIRIDARLPALREVLRQVEGLAAVYLFGSYGTALQTPLSDVDLALVFRKDAVPEFEEELALRGRILDALKEEDVSITVLNRAPVRFQFRVLSTGRLLYRADARALADVIAPLLSRHSDFRIDYDRFAREYDQAFRRRYARA